MNVFWQTIAGYNAATWPLQALLVVAGIVLTALLYRRPSPRVKVAMKVYLALKWKNSCRLAKTFQRWL